MSAGLEYHRRELAFALDATHPSHSLPPVPPAATRILDIGCGMGQTLKALRLDPSIEAWGLDRDVEAIQAGREDADSNIHLVVGSGEHLPFPDENFDLVFSRVALPYMDIPVTLGEIFLCIAAGWETMGWYIPPAPDAGQSHARRYPRGAGAGPGLLLVRRTQQHNAARLRQTVPGPRALRDGADPGGLPQAAKGCRSRTSAGRRAIGPAYRRGSEAGIGTVSSNFSPSPYRLGVCRRGMMNRASPSLRNLPGGPGTSCSTGGAPRALPRHIPAQGR